MKQNKSPGIIENSFRPSDEEIASIRTEISDSIINAERVRLFGIVWDSNSNCWMNLCHSEIKSNVEYFIDDAKRRANILLSRMALPSQPLISLLKQADLLEAEAISLDDRSTKLRKLANGLRKCANDDTIKQHNEPIHNLRTQVDEIAVAHQERLYKVQEFCTIPRTITEIADALFGANEGYGKMPAYALAGAHIEYLHAQGKIRIDNLNDVEKGRALAIRYKKS